MCADSCQGTDTNNLHMQDQWHVENKRWKCCIVIGVEYMPANQSCHVSHVKTQKNLFMLNIDEGTSQETVTWPAGGIGHWPNL